MKVLKFGGTSMATAAAVRRVERIVRESEDAKVIVVSAPGKRFEGDQKVTDLLLAAHEVRRDKEAVGALLDRVEARFAGILRGLSVLDFHREWAVVREKISGESRAYAASRGEYFSAQIVAALLGATFIDAAELVRFGVGGRYDEAATNRLILERLSDSSGRVVVPGFYGATEQGTLVTFARGGSDITGAILAGGLGAEVYENWTDVDGFFAADPCVVPQPRVIGALTYEEAYALGKMGAGVLHPDSISPLQKAGIPIRIRNTFRCAANGTLIASAQRVPARKNPIAGIAGKKITPKRALVAVVGQRLPALNAAARAHTALKRANIRPFLVRQGEHALITEVDAPDYAATVNALYETFIQ